MYIGRSPFTLAEFLGSTGVNFFAYEIRLYKPNKRKPIRFWQFPYEHEAKLDKFAC